VEKAKQKDREAMNKTSQVAGPIAMRSDEMRRTLGKKSHFLWDDRIVRPMIDRWLTNFDGKAFSTEKEHLVALYLLSKFVFLSLEEIRYLCQLMYRQYMHRRLAQLTPHHDLRALQEQIVNRTRFYPAGQSSESGEVIGYYFRQANALGLNSFIDSKSEHPHERLESLCLVDDVSLTGDEADRYSGIVKDINYDHLLLLVMVSTEQAMGRLSSKGVSVVAPIVLKDDEIKLGNRSPTIMDLGDDIGDAFTEVEFRQFLNVYGELACPGRPLGYGGLALLLGFPHNVPDNTIPIIWATESWIPISLRYPKVEEVFIHDSPPFI
jgi:hypothetical protein